MYTRAEDNDSFAAAILSPNHREIDTLNSTYNEVAFNEKSAITKENTGGSRLSRTAVKPHSRLARIFVAKFLCIIKLI